jgi:hypothetical protein
MYWLKVTCLAIALSLASLAQTPIEMQPVKELKPKASLSTCGYTPSSAEKPFFEKLPAGERATGSFMEAYDIHNKGGSFVSWYGVVRGISRIQNSSGWELLVEHKYFDGMTDCHIMMVSMSGSGDFTARVEASDVPVPALALVRIYGKVLQQEGNPPLIQAEFVRVWPWMTFTFTDLGADDKTNRRWKKDCKLCQRGKVYRPYPNNEYYRDTLGDPAQYGAFLK